MTLEEMIALYRADAVDDAQGQFCSDSLLTIYANEAENEACRRGQLLRDSSSDVCHIAFDAGAESVPLDPVVIQVLRAFVDGHEVCTVKEDFMDAYMPGWQFGSNVSRPTHLVNGLTTGELHLWPRPEVAGNIRLTVQRLPLNPLLKGSSPEIRPELHPALVAWMLYRAYSREDTDLYNDRKAAIHLAKFEAEFGRKASGRNEEWVRQGASMGPGPIA